MQKRLLAEEMRRTMLTNKDRFQARKVLSEDDALILQAIAERIFPRSDTPGAVELGALDYIDLALAGDYASLVPLYREGLRAIGRHARRRFNRNFLALTDEQKDTLLSVFESGSVEGYKHAAEFFETVRYHILEGVFCEPQYGGNRDMSGWRLVNFPGQQFGYSDAYIDKRVDLEPVAVDSNKREAKSS